MERRPRSGNGLSDRRVSFSSCVSSYDSTSCGNGLECVEEEEELRQSVGALVDAVREATAAGDHSLFYARMLADTHTPDDLRKLLLGDASHPSTAVNVTSLYKHVVVKALNVARCKVLPHPTSHKLSVNSRDLLERHKLYAASECFGDKRMLGMHYVNVSDAVNELSDEVTGARKIVRGIITEVKDGKPVFIHRSVAEYLAALWLKDKYSSVPLLMRALYEGRFGYVRYFFDALLAEGRPLHEAALSGRPEAVDAALQGADQSVDEEDAGGRRAVHLAALSGREEIVRKLLERNADVSARDKVMSWTALCYADSMVNFSVRRKSAPEFDKHVSYLHVIDHLLGNGSFINNAPTVLTERKFVLRMALENDYSHLAKALIEKRYPVFLQRTLNTKYMKVAAEHKSARTVTMLVKCGFRVNVCLEDGKTPLHVFAGDGNEEVCDLLISHGASVNQKCSAGSTALHEAATWKHDNVCRLLLSRGANVNAADLEGETPLHRGVEQDDGAVCRLLLENGAKVDGLGKCTHTPLQTAMLWGHYTIERLLIQNGAKTEKGFDIDIVVNREKCDKASGFSVTYEDEVDFKEIPTQDVEDISITTRL